MGQVYYDMGFLSSAEVVECSASDLVGQYVGQTGPKTKAIFERALGKVLFVDEAYRLSEGHFAKEAMDELVGILTQERFKAKLVVILAGYDQEINQLLSVNPGLSSRFPDEIVFENMTSAMCIKVLEKALAKENIVIDGLVDPSQLYTEFVILFDQLSDLPSWGNARDVITISKKMIRTAIENSLSSPQQGSGTSIILFAPDALACVRDTLKDLCDRGNLPRKPSSPTHSPLPPIQPPPTAAPPSIKTTSATKQATTTAPPEQPPPEPVQEVQEEESVGRDPGVTDAVWRQLQADKAAAIEEQKRREEAIERARKEFREAQEAQEKAQMEIAKALEEARSADQKRLEEIKRKLEEERLREAAARAERARKLAELRAREEAEKLERQREAQAQAKLRCMGVCPVGFRWIKQAGGYRCAGGAHFVTDSQLGL
jgi:SpoVK/Ycf46/Vps4 family AAA+-type ATPase